MSGHLTARFTARFASGLATSSMTEGRSPCGDSVTIEGVGGFFRPGFATRHDR
jgi:hypothetical protein